MDTSLLNVKDILTFAQYKISQFRKYKEGMIYDEYDQGYDAWIDDVIDLIVDVVNDLSN